jgi:hypothetical protein
LNFTSYPSAIQDQKTSPPVYTGPPASPPLPDRTPLTDPYVRRLDRFCRDLFRFQDNSGPQPDDGLTDAEIEAANRANSAAIIAEIQALTTGRNGR